MYLLELNISDDQPLSFSEAYMDDIRMISLNQNKTITLDERFDYLTHLVELLNSSAQTNFYTRLFYYLKNETLLSEICHSFYCYREIM
jgi:hypothetical protein